MKTILLCCSFVFCVILIFTNVYSIKTVDQIDNHETHEEVIKNPTCSASTKNNENGEEKRKSIIHQQSFCENNKDGNGKIYCENPQEYPLEKINNLLSKMNIDHRNGLPVIQNRMNLDYHKYLCPIYNSKVRPLIGLTEEGGWFPIVYSKSKNISQDVYIIQCSQDVNCSACSKIDKKSKNLTQCEQMYSIYPLFGFDGEKNEIRRMRFKIPTACMCIKYKNIESKKCATEEEIKNWNCTVRGASFCTEVTDYDKKILPKIEEALDVEAASRNYKVLDALYNHSDVSLFDRFSLTSSDSACVSSQKVIYPKLGESTDGEWYSIINTNKLQQKIIINECLPESLDKKNADSTKICIQRHAVFNLYAYDHLQNDISEMEFLFPYGCVSVEVKVENNIEIDDLNTNMVIHESDTIDLGEPKCIKKLDNNLCLEVENYPTEYINKLFEKGAFDEFKTIHQEIDVATRISPDETLCDYDETTNIPTAYDGKYGSKLFVVQAENKNFTQKFVHRLCKGPPNDTCDLVEKTHHSKCVNLEFRVPMVVIYRNGKITRDSFLIKSWCVCKAT